jgi:MarR family transcriptional regulator for hemolysin
LRADITQTALSHMNTAEARNLVRQLEAIKDNVRDAIQSADSKVKDQRYG